MTEPYELVLQNFLIDIVEPVEGDKLRLVTYSVLAPNPQEALRRFFQEEAGNLLIEQEPTDRVLVGLQLASDAILEGERQVYDD